jgi:hypothetical protein
MRKINHQPNVEEGRNDMIRAHRATGPSDFLPDRRFTLAGERAARRAISLAVLAAMLIPTFGRAADEAGTDTEATRAALEQWVETQRVISLEKRDFELSKQILTERIELVQREIEELQAKIGEAEKSIGETDAKRGELFEQNDKLKAAADFLGQMLIPLETRTREMVRRLPDPLKERLKPLSQRLPDNSEDTEISLSERFQNVVGILNEVNKANREISVTSESRKLPDGTAAEVTGLYLGVGQGFYVGANGTVAGVGQPIAEGWNWKADNASAPKVTETIAILKNEQVAKYVPLPLEIQ